MPLVGEARRARNVGYFEDALYVQMREVVVRIRCVEHEHPNVLVRFDPLEQQLQSQLEQSLGAYRIVVRSVQMGGGNLVVSGTRQ